MTLTAPTISIAGGGIDVRGTYQAGTIRLDATKSVSLTDTILAATSLAEKALAALPSTIAAKNAGTDPAPPETPPAETPADPAAPGPDTGARGFGRLGGR